MHGEYVVRISAEDTNCEREKMTHSVSFLWTKVHKVSFLRRQVNESEYTKDKVRVLKGNFVDTIIDLDVNS